MSTADQVYPIVGIQDGLDPDKQKLLRKVELRLELDEWYQSQLPVHLNQRALFFPAFWRFSQLEPQEKLSWFQVAGKVASHLREFRVDNLDSRYSRKTICCLG